MTVQHVNGNATNVVSFISSVILFSNLTSCLYYN